MRSISFCKHITMHSIKTVSYPSMDISTDGFVTLESSVHSTLVFPLVQFLQNLSHVTEPRLPQSRLPGKLLCQLQ